MRHVKRWCMALWCLFVCAVAAPGTARADGTSTPAMRQDAQLQSVHFLDARLGWAAGDRGTIWHTDDGGQSWQLQQTGVDCRLSSVFFVDSQHGWAAGGRFVPHLHTTAGVLLRTTDGGRRWQQEADGLLPALAQVGFFNPAQGWAVGESSGMYPSGVFSTENGGRSWTPLPGAAADGWLAADFVDLNSGALAGRRAALAAVRRRAVEPSRGPGFGIRGLRRMKLDRRGGGWLVGDGALVLQTTDLGLSWQLPAGALPEGTLDNFDFRALAAHGEHCWVAGTPGTRVLHSADGGRTWQSYPTGQNLPLDALHFVDAQRGWAVGALGTILATRDGGRTWHLQRSGGTRLALLGLLGDAAAVPWELLAQTCGNDGYLGAVQVLARRDVDQGPRRKHTAADRVHDAVVHVGGCGADVAWQFPIRQAGLQLRGEQLLQGWNLANDGRGVEQLERYVVRQIRCWRPEVLVTHAAGTGEGDPLGHVVNQIVQRAVESAADGTRYPDMAAAAGLQPWRVKKVFGALPPGEFGVVNLNSAQLAPRLGASLAQLAAEARALVRHRGASPANVGFRLSINTLPGDTGRGGLMNGLVLHPGGEARRLLDDPQQGLETLRRAAEKYRNVQAIFRRAEQHNGSAALLTQLDDLTSELGEAMAAEVLFQLAQQYHHSGRWQLAAEVFDLLARQHPGHPLAAPAQLWLVQYYASGEAAWRVGGAEATSAYSPLNNVSAAAPPGEVGATGAEARWQQATEWGRTIERTNPALFAEPQLRFPLAVAHVNGGWPRQAQRFYLAQRRTRGADIWRRCAEAERWLEDRGDEPPKPLAACPRATEKPYLDGKLDDNAWKSARSLPLTSRVGDAAGWPGEARLAWDDEFLYLAVRCRRAAAAEYPASEGPRQRDADLSAHDRVDFLLDVDRDYATAYRLTIDHRGHPAEACWGDASWNPQWFVAAGGDESSWTAEAAIPWRALTGSVPQPGKTVWALGVQRTVPGAGFQSWTAPASIDVQPEGFGLLQFQ